MQLMGTNFTSQNFLWNPELVERLIRGSSITKDDLVVEIGPGKGIITEHLLRVCRKLIAVESDEDLYKLLQERFLDNPRITLVREDFLKYPLPKENYKIFSNPPFSITGEIIKKLLFSQNPPVDSYLVVQRDAAEKHMSKNSGNTMLAILFYPWFEIDIIYEFLRKDFKPTPGVESSLIRIEQRSRPLVEEPYATPYRDYVVYNFTRDRSATSLSQREWLIRFAAFVEGNDRKLHSKIMGSFGKWQIEEQQLSKIHRTRSDGDWKKFH